MCDKRYGTLTASQSYKTAPKNARIVAITLTNQKMIDKTGQLIAAFSFLAFVLNIPPMCYHVGNRNIPASSLIFWLCYNNLTSFVNVLIWSGENFYLVTDAPGYCDLTVRISSGAPTGKICSLACLIMNLYLIIDARHHKFLESGSKRRTYINLAVCWTTPIFIMGTSVIVQSSRYVIMRYRGCVAPYGSTYVSFLLVTMWPLIWSFVATVFAVLTVWTYLSKRRDIKNILKCTNSGLNLRRFARLLVFSLLIMFMMCPFAIYNFVSDVKTYGLSTFNFAETHNDMWNYIYKIDPGNVSFSSRIVDIVLSVITFLLFGLGTDALDMYRRALVKLGFSMFKKPSPDEIAMSNEFMESRNPSRSTQKSGESEATVNSMFELSKFNELAFDSAGSIRLTPTLHKSGAVYIESGWVGAEDLEAHLERDSGSSLDLHFHFDVKHH